LDYSWQRIVIKKYPLPGLLYPKMLNGTRKNLSNLVLDFVTYLWDTTLEYYIENHHRYACLRITDLKTYKDYVKRHLPHI
jgi:hypothetical protein